MSSHGAALQSYNNDMVKAIEQLVTKRDALDRDIQSDRQKKSDLEKQLNGLKSQLKDLKSRIETKENEKQSMEATLVNAEKAYTQILSTTQTLLNSLHAKIENT